MRARVWIAALLAALMAVMYALGRLGEKVEGHAKAGKT